MELKYPIGLIMLLGAAVLLWLFRRKERLSTTVIVSTNRWFISIAPKQFPQWRWWLWPLLLAGCVWYSVAAWTWSEPQKHIPFQTVNVWDSGLNMPDTKHGNSVEGKDELARFLTTYAGSVRLHTNLQRTAWGEEFVLTNRVKIVNEPLPSSVGITRSGFLGNKIWVQFHNYSEKPWSGTLTILDTASNTRKTHDIKLVDLGELQIFDVAATLRTIKLSINSTDPWHWDDEYLVNRPSSQLDVQCDVKNLFLLTWSKLLEEGKSPKVLVTDTTRWSDLEEFCNTGGTVIWFPNGRSAENLKRLGINFTSDTPLKERGTNVTETWEHLDGLRLLGVTTWGNSTGWDNTYWSTEIGRVIIGSKTLGKGRVTVFMGPLTMPETELPSVPLFIPLMAELVGSTTAYDAEKTLRSRQDVPTANDLIVTNYDRAFIQPVKGETVSKDTNEQAMQPVDWEIFTWATIITFSLITLYSWRKRF